MGAQVVSPTSYRFTALWVVPGRPEVVFDLLADVAGYPRWWPQVRAVAAVSDDTAHVVCRSRLPYDLDLWLTRTVEDRPGGVLEARIEGRLLGWARWTLSAEAGATRVDYVQEVITSGRLLAVASYAARPLLVANHRAMMRGGRRGLLQELSSAGR